MLTKKKLFLSVIWIKKNVQPRVASLRREGASKKYFVCLSVCSSVKTVSFPSLLKALVIFCPSSLHHCFPFFKPITSSSILPPSPSSQGLKANCPLGQMILGRCETNIELHFTLNNFWVEIYLGWLQGLSVPLFMTPKFMCDVF